MNIFLFVFILFFLVSFSAILSASETSLFSLSFFTVNAYKNDVDKRKKLIHKLLLHPKDLLVTILILNVLANILIQNVVSSIFDTFPSWLLKVGVPLAITLFFGEIIPKSVALANNKDIACYLAPFINFSSRIIKPLRILITKVAGFVSRTMFFFLKKEKPLTIEELEYVISVSEEQKILTSDETDLIEGYLGLYDSNIKENLRPRDEVLFFDINSPKDELIKIFSDKEYSRVPVCDDKLDNILGVISLKRFFLHQAEITINKDLLKFLKKPLFVVETMKSWDLFLEFRKNREDIAIVVDEYGSVTGIITLEDLIEQVVGNISDKKNEGARYTYCSKDEIIASGKMEIDELENLFDIDIKRKSNAVTIGGFLIDELGDIPSAGEKITVDSLHFQILAADPNRIKKVYIRLVKQPKKRKPT